MIPIKDYLRTKSFPAINVGFLVITVGVFIYQATLSRQALEAFLLDYAFVADRFFENPLGQAHTLITTIFLHGGLLHVGGNMLFLFIFGDNLEDALGHVRYFLFYLIAGALAALAQGLVVSGGSAPIVGASGAISAVMGGYMILYPGSSVLAIIPIGIFLMPARLPAFVFLGVWALLQFLYGWQAAAGQLASNVGYLAHIAGFAFGLVFCWAGKRRFLEKVGRERPMLYGDNSRNRRR
jgi:membrane associated rhomboid family serine protease